MNLVVYVTKYPDDGVSGSHQFLRQFTTQLTDGLLLSLSENETLDEPSFDVPYPLVCFGTRNTYQRVDRVTTDDVVDARTATEYLLERGSTSIAVVGAHAPFNPRAIATAGEGNAELRTRGIAEALQAAGRPLDPRLVGVTGYDWTIGAGFRAALSLIDSGIPFDGLVCLNDGLATGAISALRESGLQIPADVQVIGFDNVEESAFLAPPLTSMDSRIDWIARAGLERLMRRIDGISDAPLNLLAHSQVIARGTTRT
jgi:LacI family repressor for deo operon, udp, cdd, tsx, nupC, and nupG